MTYSEFLSTFLDQYRKAVWETLGKDNYEYDYDAINACLNYELTEAFMRTSHVVKATTVAWGRRLLHLHG